MKKSPPSTIGERITVACIVLVFLWLVGTAIYNAVVMY